MRSYGLENASFHVTYRDLIEASIGVQADKLKHAADFGRHKKVVAAAMQIVAMRERRGPVPVNR